MKTSSLRARLGCVLLASIASIASSGLAQAAVRSWKKIIIPGARCGNGSPYTAFLSMKDPRKFALELMGGGACWDRKTCWGPTPLAWIHEIPGLIERLGGFFSLDLSKTDAADHTLVHFPYCTGDVHLGRHKARYQAGVPVWHYGAINVERGLDHLVGTLGFDPYQVGDLTVYGYSAGAIGALAHIDHFSDLFPAASRRTLLADAPGLHFGPKFWEKFSPELLKDYAEAIRRAGHELDTSQGMLAKFVSTVCERHPGWEIGVMQGSKDVVMSALFGAISPDDHHRSIFGPEGLWEQTRDVSDNCSAWIPTSTVHTFMVSDPTAEIRAGQQNAYEFLNGLMRAISRDNHRD